MKNNILGQLKKTVKEARHNMKSVNSLMKSIDPIMVRMTWVGAFFGGLSMLGTFAVFGVVLQKAIGGYLSQGEVSVQMVTAVIIFIGSYYLISALVRGFIELKGEIFEDKLKFLLEQRQVEKQISLDLGRLNDPEFIALKDSCEYRGESSIRSLFRAQTRLLSSIVGVVASVSVIAFLDPVLILIAILPVIPQTIKSVVIDRKRREFWEKEHITRRKKNEYEWCISENKMLVQMKLFRFVEHMSKSYNFFWNQLRDSQMLLNRFDFKADLGVRLIEVILLMLAMAYLGRELVIGNLTFVEVFFFIGCIKTFGSSLFGLSNVGVEISSNCRDYGYYKKFMETKPLVDETDVSPCKIESVPTLSLHEVSFSYPRQTSSLALKNCSLTIRPGEKVAMVGQNGSGKTTVLRLLTKVFLPQRGEVTIDGVPTQKISQSSWLDHVLYVTQDSNIPDLTIEEALTGSAPEDVDMPKLLRSAAITGADEFIRKLPDGYKTQIGEEWSGGVGFSSGQLQRLKLTASFYRLLNPSVYIGMFDEPMAHCDTETRERFYQSLKHVPEKTVIVVAHDPLYLHYFERILVVEDGAITDDLRGKDTILEYRSRIAMQLSDDL